MVKRRGPTTTRRTSNGGLGSPSGSKGAMGHDEWGMDEESIGNRFWFRIIFLQNELDVERWKQRRTPGAADHDGDEPETKGGAQETNHTTK